MSKLGDGSAWLQLEGVAPTYTPCFIYRREGKSVLLEHTAVAFEYAAHLGMNGARMRCFS